MTTTSQDPFAAVAPGERQQIFARLAAGGTVHRIGLPPHGAPAWLVTGHAEVRAVLADPRMVKAPTPVGLLGRQLVPEHAPGLLSHMLNTDGDEHGRLRRLVTGAFTRRRIDALAPRIEEIAHDLLDDLEGTADLIPGYAYPLPMTVICELIGVPEDRRDAFRGWTATLAGAGYVPPEEFAAAFAAEVTFARELVEAKRAEPADDLLSALVTARDGDDALTGDELASMVFLLVAAGHETTVNLIGNGLLALLTRPGTRDRLRADPDLTGPAVEELLRFDGPLQLTFPLRATAPTTVGGTEIAAGDIVLPSPLAANRDPACFADPHDVVPARDPNPHLAFGHGVHHCVGAPLARLEARIALRAVLDRFPEMRLATPEADLRLRPSVLFHGLTALPVELRPRG